MAWKGKYVGWYGLFEEELGELVPSLSEREVVENVSAEDVLTVPLRGTGKENDVPLPSLQLRLRDQRLSLAIVYGSKKSVEHLENIFRETHRDEHERLFNLLGRLPTVYETKLYSGSSDGSEMELRRRYLSSRLDSGLLRRILDEADELRKGGRRIVNNQSVYVKPRSPEIYLASINTPLSQESFRQALREMRPLIESMSSIKTRREVIRERLTRPKKMRNVYSEFVEALNQAKAEGLISAERRRELDRRWRLEEEERDELLREIRALLNSHGQ